jgi:hypothetical protein
MCLTFGTQKNISLFVQTATIIGMQATYNNEMFGVMWDVDLSILLDVVKKNGEVYPYTMNIRANYSKDQQDNILGWGSAFKVSRLFERLEISGKVNDDGTIPESCIQNVIGKEICVLFYRTGVREDGNVKFQAWDVIDIDKQSILAEFEVSQSKGYPKNFVPASSEEVITNNSDLQLASSIVNGVTDSNPF